MTNEQPLPATDQTAQPEAAFADWLKETRDRQDTQELPAPTRRPPPPRQVPDWVLALLLGAAVVLTWFAWTSSPLGPRFPGEVHGQVRDIHRRPVAGAWVFLVADPAIETRTNSDGSFCLAGVPAGQQTVLLAEDGMGEEYSVRVPSGSCADMGNLVFRVPPLSVRRAPGGGADWGK